MSKKLTLEFIKSEIESEGFMLLSESYENARQKLQLRCPFGHKYRPVCWNNWQQGSRCTICSGKEALEGFNDLATTHPDLAKEWHPTKNGNLKPQKVTAGSDKKVWWLGECGHEWPASVNSRSKVNGTGCRVCSGQEALEGFNDLATTHPDLAKEWHPTKNGNLKPQKVTAGSDKKVWWLGECGHEWPASVNSRSKVNGTGCRVCSGQEALEGFNDLATTHPDLAKEWHPTKNGNLKPQKVTAGSDKKVWWLGECGHEWPASVNSRSKVNGTGCRVCSGQEALEGFNDLATTHPDLAKEWHPTKNGNLKPQKVTAGSDKKVWWLGECGHEWPASVKSRSKVNGTGCRVCNESKGEKAVENFLTQSGKSFEREYKFKDCKNKRCLPFDFYLLSHNLCIEYQGEQHYSPVKWRKNMSDEDCNILFKKIRKNDEIKLNYCKDNGINLLTISYEHFDNIEDIIKTYFTDSTALIKYSGVNLYITQSVQKL